MAPSGFRSGRNRSSNHSTLKRSRSMKAWTSNRVRLRESYGAAKYQHQLFSSFLNIDVLSAAKVGGCEVLCIKEETRHLLLVGNQEAGGGSGFGYLCSWV